MTDLPSDAKDKTMDRLDHLQKLGELAEDLKDDMWLIRGRKIANTDDRIAHMAEKIQRYCTRVSRTIDELIEEDRHTARREANKDQISMFGIPARADPTPAIEPVLPPAPVNAYDEIFDLPRPARGKFVMAACAILFAIGGGYYLSEEDTSPSTRARHASEQEWMAVSENRFNELETGERASKP